MIKHIAIASLTAFTFCASLSSAFAAPDVLTAGPSLTVPGANGGFDYMTADPLTHRVFASHPGGKGLVVLDTKKNDVQQIDLKTEVNGVAVDPIDNKFFTAGGGGVIFDFNRKSLKLVNQVTLDGPADGITFDSENDTLYIDNDDGTKIWAVSGKTDKLVATINIDGAPEYMAYDPATKHLFQNIKANDEVQVIDTSSNTVIASWPTTPVTKPHGLVYDPISNRLFSAGKNKLLAVIDAATGKVITSVSLASATDQIAFDPKLRRIYAPGGGFITVVGVAKDGTPTVLGQISVSPKAHTLTVDPNTGNVWISYTDGTNSFLQSFTPGA